MKYNAVPSSRRKTVLSGLQEKYMEDMYGYVFSLIAG